MLFEIFEKQVVEHILRKQTEQNNLLFQQFIISEIISREFTGCGFFTDYYIRDKSLSLPGNVNIELWGFGELEGVDNGVGFILFIRDGFISLLEGYVNTGVWPKNIGDYKFISDEIKG